MVRNKKISELTEYVTPVAGDYLAVVDTANGETKKIDFINFKGDKGDKGDTGTPGTAATVDVGTTTTLPEGSSATVTNSGDTTTAVFNFGIPKGDKGDKGDTGPQGVQGETGATGPQGPSGTGEIITGTCATAAATSAKEVTIAGYTLTIGDFFAITFTNGNSANSITLNINGGGAVNVKTAGYASTFINTVLTTNGVLFLYYDGTNFNTTGSTHNSTYSEISEAEITEGTATTGRTISGRRAAYILTKALPIGGGTLTGGLTAPSVTISDGGTVGQAAGPLLTFDDTNNYLEVTGCNVGIGTTTPQHKLELAGTTNVGLNIYSTDNSDNPYIQLSGNSGTVATEGLKIYYSDSGAKIYFDSIINNDNYGFNFRTKVAGTPVNAFTILGSGKVGILNASPSVALDVTGSIKASTAIETPAIKITTGAGAGKVLTSDADGDATWGDAATGDMTLAGIQSVTGLKTFDKDKIAMKGTSTGVTTISTANTSASNYTITLPAATGTLLTSGGALGTPSSGTLTNCTGYPAASTTAAGISELAIASEVNTGTSTTLAVTPDALAGSVMGTKGFCVIAVAPTTDVSAADGKAYIMIPECMNGMNLVRANASVVTAGTTNATTIDIYNVTDSHDMLSTAISIASGGTVGTAGTVNASYDDVATNDILRIDVTSASTTNAKGLQVVLEFRLP